MSNPRSLPPEFTIYSLATLRKQWLASLPKGARGKRAAAKRATAWTIDASAVTEVDAAALQLLVSLSQALAMRNSALTLVDPSGPLRKACDALGLGFLASGPGAVAVRS
jgi:ABC-type transporter Mla MlaB component